MRLRLGRNHTLDLRLQLFVMSHPFTKIFDTALRKSTPMDNVVLTEAEKLKGKGYSAQEIYGVLVKLKQELIADADVEIVEEAVEAFAEFVD